LKNSFKGFYNPTDSALDEAWKSDETIFVFDTNVFLNLYGYAEQTRNDFFDLLESIGDKIWLPYQVGLEYQRRRLEVIRDEKGIFNKISDNLDKIEKVFKGDFEQLALSRRFPKLHDNTEKLSKEIHKSINAYKKSVTYWDDKQPCVRSHDNIRDKINTLTDGKLGNPPENQAWLDSLYSNGEERYSNKIPPGFKDANKAKSEDRYFFYDELKYDRQFGDLILWMQLIEKASDENIKNVIFITDDSKEDWWYILDSKGKKQIGPHANLQSEVYKKSSVDLFHMYNTSTFLENGKKILNAGVHESSIQDANTFWVQTLGRTTRILKEEISFKEEERDTFKKTFLKLKDYNRYKNLLTELESDDESRDLEDLRRKLRKKEEFIKYINLKGLDEKWPLSSDDENDDDDS
jgi:hypothetical protein